MKVTTCKPSTKQRTVRIANSHSCVSLQVTWRMLRPFTTHWPDGRRLASKTRGRYAALEAWWFGPVSIDIGRGR